MNSRPEPLERLEFDAAALMAQHPPQWRHLLKRLVYEIACPPDRPHAGRIHYSRWAAAPLPERLVRPLDSCPVEGREDVYDYQPVGGTRQVMEWHVNFADPHLFVAYASRLFAQDEMQVTEHPALGALREALDAGGHPALTVEDGRPTPVLVAGVERRVRIATEPNSAEGRPSGLYGNAFATASPDAIRRAATPIVPPTISNILAMAAPRPGVGRYSREEILGVLTTAYTGFSAAHMEAQRLAGPESGVVMHTGFWGCGAFGGNRVLMALLQAIAASLAALERLVFHTFNVAGTRALHEALAVGDQLRGALPAPSVQEVVDSVHRRGFRWGVSDGN